jgi:hypothetical protein
MQYRVSPARTALVVRAIEGWLASEDLERIVVDNVGGVRTAREQHQAGSYSREELAEIGTAEALIDLVVEEFGQRGGKLQMRGVFRDPEGKETNRRRMLQLTRVAPGERTGSQGRDAGFERLAGSLSSAVDQLGRRLDHSQDQVVSALQEQGASGERFYGKMLDLQEQSSETSLAQAVAIEGLSRQIQHDRELFDLRMEMQEAESIWNDLLPQILPGLVAAAVPVMQAGARLIESKVGAPAAPVKDNGGGEPEPIQPESPQDEEAADAPPPA